MTKTKELIKKIEKLERALDTYESNLKLFVKNFTNYDLVTIEQSSAWYELHKNNIRITLDDSTEKPTDIEDWIWSKLLDYVGAIEKAYNRYIELI